MKTTYTEILKDLEDALQKSQEYWNTNQSHPFIIGYLQGIIKGTINNLQIIQDGKNF